MHYELNGVEEKDALLVPRSALDFCENASEAELKVLLFAASVTSFEEADAVRHFEGQLSETDVLSALAFWRGAGLFGKTSAKKPKTSEKETLPAAPEVKIISSRPHYTARDLAAAAEDNRDFKSLIDYAEHRLNKNFNASDLSLLYSFVDYLGLGVDVVMLAIEGCAEEGKTSLRYIEKLLIAFADDGIDTYEAAEEYMTRRRDYLSFEGKIRALCGFGTRALTGAEKKIVARWKDEYQLTDEELTEAYDKTVTAISKPSLSYMNKVIATAREGKANTQARVEEASAALGKTYETKSRFAAAVARTKKKQEENA